MIFSPFESVVADQNEPAGTLNAAHLQLTYSVNILNFILNGVRNVFSG